MIENTDVRIITLMIEKINRLIEIYNNYSTDEIKTNYIYSDTILYEFEKLYEDSTKLSPSFLILHPDLPIKQLRSIRNRIAHDYESVSIQILIDTIEKDLPALKSQLEGFIDEKNSL